MTRRNTLNKVILVGITGIVVGLLGIRAIPILFIDGGNWHHKIHWMVYGYDEVWYHHRAYVDPSQEISLRELEREYGQGEKFISTGHTVIGLPVYDTPSALAFERRMHVVSTLLFLKKPDGQFIVYALSGGP